VQTLLCDGSRPFVRANAIGMQGVASKDITPDETEVHAKIKSSGLFAP